MSRRNLILLIITLVIVTAAVFGFLYFQSSTTTGTVGGDSGTNFLSQFNPFGSSKTNPPAVNPPVDISGGEPNPTDEMPKTKLTKISSMGIAGFAIFLKERLKNIPVSTIEPVPETSPLLTTKAKTPIKPTPPPTEFVPAFRYVERATGNIYQTFADKIEERKFSGTMIPKVYDAYFGNHGESVVMRYLKTDGQTIETFVGNLPREFIGADTTGDNQIKGSFLPNDIKDLSISPDTLKVFYLFAAGDSLIGTTMNFIDNRKVQIFDSTFTEWLSQWGSSSLISLSTKPSGNVPGYMYSVDPAKKNLSKVLGGVNGLTTLTSPNGKLILYSDNNLSLAVYHTDTRTVDPLSVRTLPEKCVWGRVSDIVYCAIPKSIDPGLYPDTWYQGEISFSDQLWKIDVKTGNATLLLDPLDVAGEEIDGIKLATDDSENYLLFMNKKDSYLWKLDLR